MYLTDRVISICREFNLQVLAGRITASANDVHSRIILYITLGTLQYLSILTSEALLRLRLRLR